MVEARIEVGREEFDAITRRLIARAEGGRGRVRRIPSADTEDVVQDAWEKNVKRKRGLPEGHEREAFLQEALVDTTADYWRREQRRRQIPRRALQPLDATVEDRVPAEESEDTRLAVLQARELLRVLDETAGNDDKVKQFAILAALDYTEKEIAERLGVEEREAGAIRKRFDRTRPAIRKALNQEPHTHKEEN